MPPEEDEEQEGEVEGEAGVSDAEEEGSVRINMGDEAEEMNSRKSFRNDDIADTSEFLDEKLETNEEKIEEKPVVMDDDDADAKQPIPEGKVTKIV